MNSWLMFSWKRVSPSGSGEGYGMSLRHNLRHNYVTIYNVTIYNVTFTCFVWNFLDTAFHLVQLAVAQTGRGGEGLTWPRCLRWPWLSPLQFTQHQVQWNALSVTPSNNSMFAHCTNMCSAHCAGMEMALTFPSAFDPVKTPSEKCFHYRKRQIHCIKSEMNMFRK